MMILGCMHALLLAEATTQLVDIHGHTEYILNSQLTRTYHGAPAVPASAQSSAFDGEAAEPSPTSLPTEILRGAATGELLLVLKWLRKGGPIDALCTHPTAEGQTIEVGLLHASAATGHLEMVRWLLQRGASVDLQQLQANSMLPSRGGTPLMQAASYGHASTVLLLLQHSANPDAQDIYGNTALMLATTQGHVACVQALLRAGANTELFNFETKHTALQWAESKGQPEIAELILQHACRARGLGVALGICAVLPFTRPSMIPWVVLGTVAFVALLNIVVVSLKLTAGLGHHRAATQRRPPHRGARSSKAKGRKTAAEPLHQCAAPSQPATEQARADAATENLLAEEAEQAKGQAPSKKSKRKAKAGRATAPGEGEVAALDGAFAAVPRDAREGGVTAEERYVGEDKLEKWRQEAAEREARQEAAAEAARLAVLERAQQAAAIEAVRVAAAADAREEAEAVTTSPALTPAATTPSASKFRANAKAWFSTSDAKARVQTAQPPPEPAMALATAIQEVAAAPATADALEQVVAVGSEGGINGAAGPSEASKDAAVPDDYMCSITAEIMTDPVCTSDGFSYEREAITEWLRTNNTSPLTGATLENKVLIPNLSLRGMIRRFVAAQAHTALCVMS